MRLIKILSESTGITSEKQPAFLVADLQYETQEASTDKISEIYKKSSCRRKTRMNMKSISEAEGKGMPMPCESLYSCFLYGQTTDI